MKKVCPKCGKEFAASCSRVVCCSKRCAKLGIAPTWLKGKTFEEIYGVAKAKLLKQKIGAKVKGKRYALGSKHSSEFKNNMSKRLVGNTFHKGVKMSEEAKAKIRANALTNPDFGMRGKIISIEARKRMSQSKKIYYQTHSAANKGIKHHPDSILKQSLCKRGSLNPAWNGGTAYAGYDSGFNKYFKKTIVERDRHCMVCNKTLLELYSEHRKIAVHHINYDKKLTAKENCILLCQSCHSSTNVNRRQWLTFFQSLLAEKYGYQYFENKIVVEIKGGING